MVLEETCNHPAFQSLFFAYTKFGLQTDWLAKVATVVELACLQKRLPTNDLQ